MSLKAKNAIQNALNSFTTNDFKNNALQLFESLGYASDKQLNLDSNTAEGFLDAFNLHGKLNADRARLAEWQTVEFLFQLSKDEIGQNPQISLFTSGQVDNSIIESYLFLAIELQPNPYTRTDLARITREVNKQFQMPVLILFKHGDALTFSIINRRLHKRDSSKDVLEKVTLIKDINVTGPHRAHVEILFDLSLPELYRAHGFANFVALHQAWQITLDSSELNKRFFREVADWYFWAMDNVTFPQVAGEEEQVRNATSVIRLITRLIFVWFLKEKGLVPDDLFNRRKLADLLTFEDPTNSTYYKAILQNLFFATLNQEMNVPAKPDNRKFRYTRSGGRDPHYMIHNLYRYERYFTDPQATLALFSTIPFLNGGLFECLDKNDPHNPQQLLRIDGFSDRADNPLRVPDFLFFGDEREFDLNPIYGTKGKGYKVRGLIDILSSYKFTITENTPIEEEIALDPELLGQVFENLLAAYNPETETTARKQTGSFYTPREIVNYMVDESLVAYLATVFQVKAEDESLASGPKLRHLLAYNEEPHQFSETEVTRLIEAIDTLKILDPAAGSGAFPMGILHKLVFILGKLDPHNERWKEKQIEKAVQIPDSTIRHRVIEEIEEAFERNELDYGRKLYLIENCIYGVDIQPIAVQIAKLRFFISLVVDQIIDDRQSNRGVLPLPNLETKFVAANTLLGIDKPPQMSFKDPTIVQKERELEEVRHHYFTARTPPIKEKYRQMDVNIREEIGELLKGSGFRTETTQKLAAWNPYDQNATVDFFDPAWMFGINTGFNIVIGNPPYISYYSKSQKIAYRVRDRLELLKKKYNFIQNKKAKGRLNSMSFFVERGIAILDEVGTMTYIVDISIHEKAARDIRRYIMEKAHLVEINYSLSSFSNVISDQSILVIGKGKVKKKFARYKYSFGDTPRLVNQTNINSVNGYAFYFSMYENLLEKIEANAKNLSEYVFHTIGVQIGGKQMIYQGATIESLFLTNERTEGLELYKNIRIFDQFERPITRGFINFDVELGKIVNRTIRDANIALPNNLPFVNERKIILKQSSIRLVATLADRGQTCEHKFFLFKLRDASEFSLEYLLALINSTLLTFYALERNIIKHGERKQPQIRIKEVIKLPVKYDLDLAKQLETLVRDIFAYTNSENYLQNSQKQTNVKELKLKIDQLVYQLYGLTAEEIAIVEAAAKG